MISIHSIAELKRFYVSAVIWDVLKNSEDSTKDEHREQTQHTRKYTYISVLSARKVPFNIFHLGRHVFFRSKQTAKMNETAIVLGSGMTFATSLLDR